MYYGDYLGLERLLSAQHLESERLGVEAHDELLFIIIHQAYELWFKQLMHELESILRIFSSDCIDDTSEELQTVEHRLNRMVEIWKLLVAQVKVLETMTAMDFLDFRDLLNPASGFQSFQFRIFEARLGLKMEARHQLGHYREQLRGEHLDLVSGMEAKASLFEVVEAWLARFPLWEEAALWSNLPECGEGEHRFWVHYEAVYRSGLRTEEQALASVGAFRALFYGAAVGSEEVRPWRLSPLAARSALFIMLYRGYPLLQVPFKILDKLLEMDELMATWRYRHMMMVKRMIGSRVGTGGSSGADYLRGAMERHHIFGDLTALASFLVPRRDLPVLSQVLQQRLRLGK